MTFGRRSVVWTLDGERIFADGRGVGSGWQAYLIVNLSVCAGRYHAAPEPETLEMSYEVRRLVVTRPFGGRLTDEPSEVWPVDGPAEEA